MRELQVFNFDGNEVEIFEYKGEILFNPKDVAKCLDISVITVRDHIRRFNENQVIKLTNKNILEVGLTNFRKLNNAGENFLKEAGVYKLIFKSRKPDAEKFQDWVTDEVLPQIRKTGGYIDEGATTQQLEQLQHKINKLLNYKIKGDTINDVCSATGLRRKDIKQYLFDNDWVVEYNGKITNYDYRYIFIVRQRDIHFTAKGLDKILKDLQPLKPVRPLINKELYRK